MQVTGTATITSLGTGFNGCRREVRFSGTPTLTHSANLVLAGGANITVSAGEILTFRCVASGQWIMVGRARVDVTGVLGYTPLNKAGDFMTGLLSLYMGTVGTQEIVQRYGWGNSIQRWAAVLETDASLSFYRYDSAGATPTLSFQSSMVTGAFSVSGPLLAPSIGPSGSNQGFQYTWNTAEPGVGRNEYICNYGGGAGGHRFYVRPTPTDVLTSVMVLSTAGDLTISGTGTGFNWVATSDANLKKDVTDRVARDRLPDLLRFVDFLWKDDDRADLGLIA